MRAGETGAKNDPPRSLLLATCLLNPVLQRANRFLLPCAGLAAPLVLPTAWTHSAAAGCGVLGACAMAHGALAYATLRPNNALFGPVATRFEPTGDEVWLTIDDGPDPHDTPRLLDLLDAQPGGGARATFFLRGDRARAHPALVGEIVRRGHGVGNHTLNHPQATFWCAGPRRLAREIGGCSDVLRALTGWEPRLFRAPVGHVNPFVHRAAARRGLRLVGWSARGFDGVDRHAADPAGVVARISEGLRPGAIILLHEGRRGRDGGAVNVRATELLLATLAERRWQGVVPDVAELR